MRGLFHRVNLGFGPGVDPIVVARYKYGLIALGLSLLRPVPSHHFP